MAPSAAAAAAVNRCRYSNGGNGTSSNGGNDTANELKQFDERQRCVAYDDETCDPTLHQTVHPAGDTHHHHYHHLQQPMTSYRANEWRRDWSPSDVSDDQSHRADDVLPPSGPISDGIVADDDLGGENGITDVSGGTTSVEIVDKERDGGHLHNNRLAIASTEVPRGDSSRELGDADNDWEVRYFSLFMQDGSRKVSSADRLSLNRCDGGAIAVNCCNCKRLGVELSSRPRLNFRKMQVILRHVFSPPENAVERVLSRQVIHCLSIIAR